MAITITHPFISLKADGGDATLVRPTNWNANHATSMATGRLVGRTTAGVGPFEEIPISTYMAGLLNTADAATLIALLGGASTGTVKFTFEAVAPTGWILLVGGANTGQWTIGNAGSGATIRANADTSALYTLLWNNCAQAQAEVAGGRGASAAADFAALKVMAVPNPVGKAITGKGIAISAGGPNASARVLGETFGLQEAFLAANQIPSLTSSGNNSITVTGSAGGNYPVAATSGISTVSTVSGGGFNVPYLSAGGGWTQQTNQMSNAAAPITVNYTNGAQVILSRLSPSIALNCMVKL